MGKWTPDYTDDVLHSKISTLLSGAIRRLAVEKGPTTITYENFVNDLDIGDSFTATLMDILVKEVADRRLRANLTERDLLSEATVRSLRSLLVSSRTYTNRFRSHARRPAVNVPEYLSVPPPQELDMVDDDDDDGFQMEVEGARIPSELHEAYSGSRVPPWSFSVPTRRGLTSSPTPSDGWQSPTITRPWLNTSSASSTLPQGSLSRQTSIRRRIRVDFNDSTERRRWSRESMAAVSPRPDAPETVTEPRDGLVWSRPFNSTSRRFFPLQRTRRRDPWSSHWADAREDQIPDTEDSSEPIPATVWSEPSFFEPPSSDWHRIQSESRPIFRIPRLRHGGATSAESMVSRRASPVIITSENATPSSSAVVQTPVVVLTPPLDAVTGETSTLVHPVSPSSPLLAAPAYSSYSENQNLT